jgi:hypothetical protein
MLAACLPAYGQQPWLGPSPYLSCLTRAPGAPPTPEYPAPLLKGKVEAGINIELEFWAPDAAPVVRVAKDSPYDDFDDSIKNYARHFRLPCLAAGAKPVILTQRYHFNPTDGRKIMPPITEDAGLPGRQVEADCYTHIFKGSRPEPPKPGRGIRDRDEGKVLARLTFHSPTAAPQIKFLAEIGGPSYRRSVEPYAKGLRVPCLKQELGPLVIDIFFMFMLEGEGKKVFRDMTLKDLLGITKDPQPISADFNTMACPFDIRLTYLQPHVQNRVQEIETTNPARKPILEWLRNWRMNGAPDLQDALFADKFNLTIPCGRIEL